MPAMKRPPVFQWMDGNGDLKTTISHVKIWKHPIKTTYKLMVVLGYQV